MGKPPKVGTLTRCCIDQEKKGNQGPSAGEKAAEKVKNGGWLSKGESQKIGGLSAD